MSEKNLNHALLKKLPAKVCRILIACLILNVNLALGTGGRTQLPKVVRKAVEEVFEGASVQFAQFHERDEKKFYEILLRVRNRRAGLIVSSNGQILRQWWLDDEDEEGEEDDDERVPGRHEFVARELKAFKPEALGKAIEFLAANYPDRYSNKELYIGKLKNIEKRLVGFDEVSQDNLAAAEALLAGVDALRRQVLLANNPLLPEKLLFVKRYTYQSSHHYTDYIDGVARFGGNLCILTLKDGAVTEFADSMKKGFFDRCDLSFDGKRVVFAWKGAFGEGFRLYEINVDGTGLRQLTFPPPEEQELIARYNLTFPGNGPDDEGNEEAARYDHHTDDLHPCYLPDGGICFISTRCQYGTLCDIPDLYTTTVLYRIDADGSNMRKLSNGALSEAAPGIMNDGRILYTRWEYVDKGTFPAKGLWTIRPDGSGSGEIFGNQVLRPMTLIYGNAVPETADKFFAIATYHGPYSVGKVVSIDISAPIRTTEPVTYVIPSKKATRPDREFHEDPWLMPDGNYRHFIDPYPLSEHFVIVAYNPYDRWNNMTGYGLYLIDTFGNRVLIHKDKDISCWQPIPLQSRRKPPVLPSITKSANEIAATLLLSDVYRGLRGVDRGTIKWLRVVEQVPRPWAARRRWSGDSSGGAHVAVSANTHLGLKVMRGVVPVQDDGSAYFTIPAEKNIYLQALDEDFMEVQRMRTFVNLQPGETRSCIGCHEMRQEAPANKPLMALDGAPLQLQPQPGDDTAAMTIHYPTYIQPILDKHCISCHSGDEESQLNLTGELTTLFSRSYESLLSRGRRRGQRGERGRRQQQKSYINVIREEAPEDGGVEPLPPYSLGSHVSGLITTLQKGHYDVQLGREEFIRLVTWIDTNAQYYGSYYGRRNLRYKDHPNFRPTPTFSQAISTTAPLPEDKR